MVTAAKIMSKGIFSLAAMINPNTRKLPSNSANSRIQIMANMLKDNHKINRIIIMLVLAKIFNLPKIFNQM